MLDDLRCDVWLQTRRRIDWLIGPLCLLLAITSVVTYGLTSEWKFFTSPIIAIGIWFWFRQTIPPNGRRHSRARIQHDHTFMVFTGLIALCSFLSIYAFDWLGARFNMWIGAGILTIFLATMLGGGAYLERRYVRKHCPKIDYPHESQKL